MCQRNELRLANFYIDNHKFLFLLYFEAKGWRGGEREEFPDLGEITSYSVAVQRSPPTREDE
jgi:hypothetical protein